jgi:Fe2+ or Zn2+ uptake regulation protein
MAVFRESLQRKAILDYLDKHRTHPTAADIHAALRKKISTLSLGTVYRNLEILTRQGRIRCLSLHQPEARYDAGLQPHGHFTCSACGTVQDIIFQPGCCRLTGELEATGNQVEQIQMELVGLCPTCKTKAGVPEHSRY